MSCDDACAVEKAKAREFAYFAGKKTGVMHERERILKWLQEQNSGRCCFESHDLIAFINGEIK